MWEHIQWYIRYTVMHTPHKKGKVTEIIFSKVQKGTYALQTFLHSPESIIKGKSTVH